MISDPQSLLAALDDLVARTPLEKLPALLIALHARAGVAMTRLEATTWREGSGPESSPKDENLSAGEAAERLGMSLSWLYKKAGVLPFTLRVGQKSLRFSAKGLERWNRQRYK